MRDAKVFVSQVSSNINASAGSASATGDITITFSAGESFGPGSLNEQITERLFPLLGRHCTLGDLVRALDGSEKKA